MMYCKGVASPGTGPGVCPVGVTVLQLTPNLEVGGAQETVLMLAKYLPRSGCRTVVGTFADGPLRSEITQLGIPVEVLPERRHSIVALPRWTLSTPCRQSWCGSWRGTRST